MAEVEEAYKLVYDARRDANKVLTMPTPAAPAEAPDAQAIKDKLAGLREEEKTLIAQVGERVGARKTLEERAAELAASILDAEHKLLGLGAKEQADKVLKDAQIAVTDIAARVASSKVKADRLAILKQWGKALGGIKGKCVISDEVPCPLGADTKATFAGAWDKERSEIEANWGGSPLAKEVAAADAAVREATKRPEEIIRQDKALGGLRQSLQAVQQQVEAIPVGADSGPLEVLRQRISTGEGRLATAQEMLAQRARYESAIEARAATERRRADLEALCVAFGPSGVRETLLSARLGELQTTLNGILDGFGISLVLHSNPWHVTINGIHSELASTSERYRAGLAFQVALAGITQVRMVVIDAADVLDKPNRAGLFGMLNASLNKGILDQAILLATAQDTATLGSMVLPDWMQVIILQRNEAGCAEVIA
jgi:hypothetical protein